MHPKARKKAITVGSSQKNAIFKRRRKWGRGFPLPPSSSLMLSWINHLDGKKDNFMPTKKEGHSFKRKKAFKSITFELPFLDENIFCIHFGVSLLGILQKLLWWRHNPKLHYLFLRVVNIIEEKCIFIHLVVDVIFSISYSYTHLTYNNNTTTYFADVVALECTKNIGSDVQKLLATFSTLLKSTHLASRLGLPNCPSNVKKA